MAAHLTSCTFQLTESGEVMTQPKLLVFKGVKRGQAFCFLPIPVDSGLPVMVNGYFELSSNRRDIWSGAGESFVTQS